MNIIQPKLDPGLLQKAGFLLIGFDQRHDHPWPGDG